MTLDNITDQDIQQIAAGLLQLNATWRKISEQIAQQANMSETTTRKGNSHVSPEPEQGRHL